MTRVQFLTTACLMHFLATAAVAQRSPYVYTAALTPDGKALAESVADVGSPGEIRFRDLPTGKVRFVCKGHTDAVNAIAFSPDGKMLASGDCVGPIRLWDTPTGKELAAFTHEGSRREGQPVGRAWSLTFSPNGKLLASSSPSRVMLWDLPSGKQRAVIETDGRDLNFVGSHAGWYVAFSPDGNTLACATGGGPVRLWDVLTCKERRVLHGHDSRVLCVALAPGGRTVATASNDGTVRLWDAETGRQTATLRGHKGPVVSVVFSPDGKMAASWCRWKQEIKQGEYQGLGAAVLFLLFFTAKGPQQVVKPTPKQLPNAIHVEDAQQPEQVRKLFEPQTANPNDLPDDRALVEMPIEQLPVSSLALALGGPVHEFFPRATIRFPHLQPLVRLSPDEVQRQAIRFDEAWKMLDATTADKYERSAFRLMEHARPLHPVYRAELLNTLIWRTHAITIWDPAMLERIIVEATLATLDESPITAEANQKPNSPGGPNSIPLGAALRMLDRASHSPQSLAKSETSFDWPQKRRWIAELWLTHLERLQKVIDPEWELLPIVRGVNRPEGPFSPEELKERAAQQLQNIRNYERNSQQQTARDLWRRNRPQLRQFLRLAYTLPPQDAVQRDEFLRRLSDFKSPLPAEPAANVEILGHNYWSLDVPNKIAEVLAAMTDWVIAWDVQASAQNGGRRDATMRAFADGRVAVVDGMGAPLSTIEISPAEVLALVETLQQQGTERPAADHGREAGDPLPVALWNQQAQRVAVRHADKTFDLLTIDALYESQREPWSRDPVNQISGKAQEALLRVFHLAVIGGAASVEKYAAFANAELQRKIPATPIRLTREHFTSAGHNPDGTLVVDFHFAPDDRRQRFPQATVTIRVPKGGEPFVEEAHHTTGDTDDERWGRRHDR